MGYRPEIDGLRAIAVSSVIIYHAHIKILGFVLFSGGFLGVDIFFVISGYLITRLIISEFENKSFSLSNFYERRARRILPALLFVIIFTIPMAYYSMLPKSLVDYSQSILSSLGFISNYYFYFSNLDYGATANLLKPFLHTWSLSIEEQYYIFFPLLIFITYKIDKDFLIYILLIFFILSIGYAEYQVDHNKELNFFSIQSRIWEISAGAILAYRHLKRKNRVGGGESYINSKLADLLSFIGLLLIFISIIYFNDDDRHPSFLTLIPISGTLLLIWFSSHSTIVKAILSSKPFVFIGLISYSLYLWHYPIFAFNRIEGYTSDSILHELFLGLAIVIISIISYYCIEKPFRNKDWLKTKFFIITIISLVFCISIIMISAIYHKGNFNSLNVQIEEAKSSPIYESNCKFVTFDMLKDQNFSVKVDNCIEKFDDFVLVIGDSHATDIFNSISILSDKIMVLGIISDGCRPYNISKKCNYEDALKFIKAKKLSISSILFTHKGSYYLSDTSGGKLFGSSINRKLPLDDKQLAKTIKYIKKLNESHSNLIVIGPHIEPNIKNFKRVSKENLIKSANRDLIVVDNMLNNIMKELKIKYVSKIKMIDYDIENDFRIADKFNFSDTDHWSMFGEIYFGEKIFTNDHLKDLLY